MEHIECNFDIESFIKTEPQHTLYIALNSLLYIPSVVPKKPYIAYCMYIGFKFIKAKKPALKKPSAICNRGRSTIISLCWPCPLLGPGA